MCAMDGRGGNANLFVRKGGASQKKIGKYCYNITLFIKSLLISFTHDVYLKIFSYFYFTFLLSK